MVIDSTAGPNCGETALVIPVLWLCGPPGVGKTSVAWRIRARLRQGRVAAAYVDIDQLGMCYPERDSDRGRHRLKVRNLASVVANVAARGATCVVVSGVVDPVHRVAVPGAVVTLCRLRADRDELVRRFRTRSGPEESVAGVVADADEMDASTVADVCVDTTGQAVPEVVSAVMAAVDGWYTVTGAVSPVPVLAPADGPVLWVSGVPGVGTSMVGYTIFRRTLDAGRAVGYLDLRQIGFGASDGVDHHLRAANVAAVWRAYRDAGAEGLVIVGEISAHEAEVPYVRALPAATLTVCRLHADRADLVRRILPRGERGSWSQPGDPLLGLSAERLRQAVNRAVTDSEALERAKIGVRVDSSGRDVAETADAVLAMGAWPLLSGGSGR
ncbi:AAA family ATPase [Amycolatopsis pigmentata]|uniref:AAA family ATPase n=1 Tax=Amycolatopsis pigmentata TaxID=450801 RepID=A0ABW5FNL9_9PSEU